MDTPVRVSSALPFAQLRVFALGCISLCACLVHHSEDSSLPERRKDNVQLV